jgi:hypothetical protein
MENITEDMDKPISQVVDKYVAIITQDVIDGNYSEEETRDLFFNLSVIVQIRQAETFLGIKRENIDIVESL